MGRKRKSSAVAERDGSYNINPQRRNLSEPKPNRGFPEMPLTVSSCEVASRQWEWVCGQLDAMGILTVADLVLVELFCVTYSDFYLSWQRVRTEGTTVEGQRGPVRNPVMLDYHKYKELLARLLAEMGLTPSSRTRLHANKDDEKDPFIEYLAMVKESRN